MISTFSRASSFTQSIVSLINGCPKCSPSSTRITLLLNLENHSKTCVLPNAHSPKVWVAFFSHCKAKFDADMLFLQVCHFIGTPEFQIKWQMFVLNRMLFCNYISCSYLKQEMTHRTLLYLHLAEEVCATSSSVTLWSVCKPLITPCPFGYQSYTQKKYTHSLQSQHTAKWHNTI